MESPIYYRNIIEIEGQEPYSLWQLMDDGTLHLVNEDEFARVKLADHPDEFTPENDPKINL